jgi:hypothetical protein
LRGTNALAYFAPPSRMNEKKKVSEVVTGSMPGRPRLGISVPGKVDARFRPDFEVPVVPRAEVGRAHVSSILPGFELALEKKLGRPGIHVIKHFMSVIYKFS